MIPLSKIMLGFHGGLIVYSVIGILAAGLRFGIYKSSYGILKFEDLTEPELPDEPDSSSSAEFNASYRSALSDIARDFNTKANQLANYHEDPQMHVLVPFITTLLLATYFMAFRLYSAETYKKTSLLISCIVLWFIIFHYTLQVGKVDVSEPYKQYFLAWYSPALALNIILLLLLLVFVGVCGRFLRTNEVYWSCNGLNLFTLDFFICFFRLILSVSAVISFEFLAGDVHYYAPYDGDYCLKLDCLTRKYPVPLFFITLPVLHMHVIFSVEHLLSLIWGKNYTQHDITAGVLSGVSSLFLLFISIAVNNADNLSTFVSVQMALALHLFHAWNLWANWRFISSCPKILNLVCRRGGNDQAEEATEGGEDTGATASATAEGQDSATVVEKGRCFLVNALIIGICLSCLVMSGISFDYKFWLQKDYYHLEAVLTAVLSSCLIKAIATTVTLINTGIPPPQNSLQVLMELIIEGSVLIIGIVGTFFVPVDEDLDYSRTIAGLSIVVLIVKIIESLKRSPLQMALEMIAPARAARSSVPRQSLTPIVEEVEEGQGGRGDGTQAVC